MDNFLEIGATVILEGLTAGMDSAKEIVGESTTAMSGMFGSLGESSAAATAKIVEGATVAGEAVQGLSERFVEAAETAKLSAEGMGAAFSGLGVLLGAGIVGAFFLHAVDETQKLILELGHLSEQTGIAIETLAGLHAVAEETGIAFQAFETAMVRLLRAQELAVEGGKSQILAFERIGLSLKDIRSLAPEDLFYKTAAAMSESSSAADTAASAIALFGRGGAALIPILKEYGDNLRVIVDEHGKASLITKDTYEATKQYQKVTADLAEAWRSVTIPAMTVLVKALEYLNAAFKIAAAVVAEFLESISATFQNTVTLAATTWASMKALTTGGAGAMHEAWSAGMAKIQTRNEDAAKTTVEIWANTYKQLKTIFADPLNVPLPKGAPTGEPKEKKDNSAEVELSAEAKHQIAMLELERKAIDEELKDKQISSDMSVKMLTDLENQEYKIRADAIEKRIKLEEKSGATPATLAKLNAQLQAAADQHEAKLTDIKLKGVEARQKAADAAAIQHQKIDEIEIGAAEKHQLAALELTRKSIDAQLKIKQLSAGEEEKLLLDLENKEYKIRKDAVVARLKLEAETTDNPVVLAKLNAELEALSDQHETKATEIHLRGLEARKKADDEVAKAEKKEQDQFIKGFSQTIDMMIFKAKSWSAVMNDLLSQILRSMVNMLAKMVAQWLLQHTVMGAINRAFHAQVLAQTAVADAAQHAQQGASNVATVTGDAAVAAAGALAWWSDVNPIIAPAMAATQFALTEAYAPIAAAAGGWDVPRDSLAMIHAREMVLPAHLADKVRDMTGGGTNAVPDRDVHVHFTTSIQALDAQGFERVIQTHNQALGRQIVRIFRNGNLKLDHALR